MSKNLSPPPFLPKVITHIPQNAPKIGLIEAQETAVEKVSFVPQAPALPAIGIFDDLPGYILDEILPIGKRLRFDAHENINDVGDQCMGLGMIIEGEVRVDRMDALGWDSIARLKAGDLIGAMEWIDSKEWEERIVAVERTEILLLPSEKLKALITKFPELQRSLERHTERHLLLTLLGAHEIFQQLEDQMLLELIEDSYLRTVANQAKLFDQNTSIAALFMISRGEVVLSKNQKNIHTLTVGEIANIEIVIGDGITELTGTAKGTTSLFVLPLEKVEMILARVGLMPSLKKIAHQQRARAVR
jgi:CRP-like cAMP-binding protein